MALAKALGLLTLFILLASICSSCDAKGVPGAEEKACYDECMQIRPWLFKVIPVCSYRCGYTPPKTGALL